MVEISVKSELDRVAPFFSILGRDELPFAASRAQNDATTAAWKEVRDAQSERFTLRNKRVASGIRREFSNKRQWPKLRSAVGAIDEFQRLQETGGTKRARRGRLAVPSEAIRRSSKGIAERDKPSAKLKQKTTFVRELPDGRGRIQRKRGRIRVLYRLIRQARIKPASPTIREASVPAFVQTFRRQIGPRLNEAMQSAGRKAKRGRRLRLPGVLR